MTMCHESYGFLPCTTNVPGNLFLVLTYGFLVYKGATYLSEGSELLHGTMGPGLIGGLLLPVLGALPEALIVLASGLSGSRDTVQSQVQTGMGLLAGSTVFLLTLLWGTCVVVGKWDLGPDRVAMDLRNTRGFSLTGTGVSTDSRTTHLARMMAISVVPFIIAGFPNMIKTTNHEQQRPAVLLALIVSFLLVLSNCVYQIFHPWIQQRRLAYVKHKLLIAGILRHVHTQSLSRLLNEDGTPNVEDIQKLFHKIDMDESSTLSRSEVHALIVGINFDEVDFDKEDATDHVMDDFGSNHNDLVMEAEFVNGMKNWIKEVKANRSRPASSSFLGFIRDYQKRNMREYDYLLHWSDDAEESMKDPPDGWCVAKAVGLMLLGTAMAAAFADPLVDAVHDISNATRIPPFLISFVVLPLATNSIGEPVSSVKRVSNNKRQETASHTFSVLYGGVTMKNTLCLGVFLALIYIRNLTWEFSSEWLMVFIVCVVMGLLTSFRTTYPLWTCLVAYAMYPLSLVLVYVMAWVDPEQALTVGMPQEKFSL